MRRSARAYEFCGVRIVSDRALPDLRRGTHTDAECTITSRRHPLPPPPQAWLQRYRLPGGRLFFSTGRVPSGYLLRFRDQADFVLSADGRRIDVHPHEHLPEETLRHLLIDQVLPLAMSRFGRLTLHASAVHFPGIGTVGFIGDTGRGKSTLAAVLAARGGRTVTDDCLAIAFGDGGPYAVPAYPGLRLRPGVPSNPELRAAAGSRPVRDARKRRVHAGALPFHGRPSPLRALFLLSSRTSAGGGMEVRECRASARFIGLLRFARVLDTENRDDLAGLFAGLATLASTVPVLRLRLRHGHSRLPAAADRIRAYAAALPRPETAAGAGRGRGGMLPS